MTGVPRWLIMLLVAAIVLIGFASYMGWLRDPDLARADYVGSVEVSADDARLYRPVPFEWRVISNAGSFTGTDTAYLRIDTSGERPVFCGWIRLDPSASLGAGPSASLGAGKGSNSIRATRWLSEARLKVGDLRVTALFVAPVEKAAGDGLNAGCLRLDEPVRPAQDAPLSFEGSPVRE
jgi:hypothetical protein